MNIFSASRLCCLLVCICVFKTLNAQKAAFFFSAHQDDWQLFMSAHAVSQHKQGAKMVFITLTAGDAGQGQKGPGRMPYYQARENGAVLSQKFLADIKDTSLTMIESWTEVEGHKIYTYRYKNTVSYFLRLPDGNGGGTGYKSTGAQSLKQLFAYNKPVEAIDGSAMYKNWNELVGTLKKIIISEGSKAQYSNIFSAETDSTINPGDHSDHVVTSMAAQEAVAGMPHIGSVSFIDYYSARLHGNRSVEQMQNAAALHACDVIGMTNGGYNSNWEPGHNAWLSREYFRMVRFATPLQTPLAPRPGDDYKNLTPLIAYVNTDSTYFKNSLKVGLEVPEPGTVSLRLLTAAGEVFSSFEIAVTGPGNIEFKTGKVLPPGHYILEAWLNKKMKDVKLVTLIEKK